MQKIKFLLFAALIWLTACHTTKSINIQDYVTLSGKITNHFGKDGSISNRKGYKKVIKIAADGTFSDTLHLGNQGQIYSFSDGNEVTNIYLKNGADVHLTLNTDEFDESLAYTGKGATNNRYLAAKMLLSEKLFSEDFFQSSESDFKTKLGLAIKKLEAHLANTTNLDPDLIVREQAEIKSTRGNMIDIYADLKQTRQDNAKLVGKPSPPFENYENYDGSTTSLSDFKGKYVYIDVWATWCGPCKQEIPFLQKMGEYFKDKDIVFVSISVDNIKAHGSWQKMIKEKKMGGIQLFADKSWKSAFGQAYNIRSIPRFILIDPNGNVTDPNMSRPSQPETKTILEKLLK